MKTSDFFPLLPHSLSVVDGRERRKTPAVGSFFFFLRKSRIADCLEEGLKTEAQSILSTVVKMLRGRDGIPATAHWHFNQRYSVLFYPLSSVWIFIFHTNISGY